MSDLQRRPGSGLSRSAREQRAYRLALIGGTSAAVAVVTFVLALFGIGSFGITLLAVVIAVLCALAFRRTVGR